MTIKKFTIVRAHKEYYFILIMAIALVVVVVLIALVTFQGSTPPAVNTTTITVPPTPTEFIVYTTPSPNTQPPVTYDEAASHKLIVKEEQRVPLSQSDVLAKNHILSLLPSGQNYGTVYSSNNINIQYVQSLDLFKVEILTIDVQSAKTEAETWFKQQGMSQQGMCDLPLGFYLSWDTMTILQSNNFTFNPLPDGC